MNKNFYTFLPVMFLSSSVFAQESSVDDFWNYSQLYKNDQGNFINLSGRLQADAAYFHDSGDSFSDVLWRRFRFGFKARYGHINAALEAEFDLNDDAKYKRLTDANLSWNLDNDIKLTILKHSAGFTLDGRTSSKKLLTPQRNNLTSNLWFTAEYFTGISIKGKLTESITYNNGVFSSDDSAEIGFTDGSYFALVSLTAKYKKTRLWDNAELAFDYVYNDVDEQGDTKNFTHVTSFSTKISSGNWHLWSDIALGQGDLGQSDLWGFVMMPYLQQTKKIQWLFRYTYLKSEQLNGLKFTKYENKLVDGKGNNYHELYAGVNYLVNSHKLKFHLGVQYTKMNDDAKDGGEYSGWGVTLAVRSYW